MSIGPNPLNDISKVYLEAVAAKPDFLDLDKDGNKKEPMKKAAKEVEAPKERLKTDRNMFSIPKDEQQSAKDRLLAKARAKRAKMSEEKKNDGNLANNYPPYDKVTRGDVIAGRLGKDQMGGKKKVEESFSNWRQDLSEVMHDDEGDKQIKEKKVNNKIIVNPKLGEAVEEIGGTLIEMVEIDEFDFVVEGVYVELLDEGYEEDDIEEAIEYALTEAKVTFGHDTPTGEKKRGNLVKAVGRLARQKLSSKVRGVKKSAKQAVATGARKVAKKALGVARKMEGGDSTPSAAHTKTRKSSTYRGAGVGTKERVSSGSYTPPAKKKSEKPADPWEGSATTPKSKTTKVSAKPKAKKKKSSKLDDLLASVRSEQVKPIAPIGVEPEGQMVDENVATGKARRAKFGGISQKVGKSEVITNKEKSATLEKHAAAKKAKERAAGEAAHKAASAKGLSPAEAEMRRKAAERKAARMRKEEVEQLDEMPYQVIGSPDGKKEKKIGKPVKSKKYADARAAELADTHKKTGGKYRSEYTEEFVDEKLNLKKEKMGDVIKDFYKSDAPQFKGRSKEKRREMAIAAKLTAERGGRKLPEQVDPEKRAEMAGRQKFSNIKMIQQKKQQLDRKRLELQKQGKLPLETN